MQGVHDPYATSYKVPHPLVLDPIILQVPHGWFEHSFRHPSLRKHTTAHEIALPVWKELDEEGEAHLWESLQSEPDDEDVSDHRFITQHKEYEKEERRLKKQYC